ncbi:MAG: DUF882 domain-containing protein [Polyangiaceae bacterium]|jgi:uncharacterized protein YcbK (DUF882 family)
MRFSLAVLRKALLPLVAGVLTTPFVGADVEHVVQPGHTLGAIARRYHVTVESIVLANHLKDPAHLAAGQALVIPGVDPPQRSGRVGTPRAHVGTPRAHGTAALDSVIEPRGHAARGFIDVVSAGEQTRIRVKDSRGRISASALAAFEHAMRQGSASYPPDPRLLALISLVSDHFGGKPIEVVSGYRSYTPTQYTAHSNHNSGKALDFRIRGVKNESLRDFCRGLHDAGCGYYPNSTFVHLDVREGQAYWVDRSHPGEPPLYDKAGSAADEGTSDVPDERSGAQPSPAAPPASSKRSPEPQPEPSVERAL